MKIDKAKIDFKCIAVVGAINIQGRVVALLQRDLSIKTSDFVEFLRVFRTRMKRQKTYIREVYLEIKLEFNLCNWRK